jgi:hypothetical protein
MINVFGGNRRGGARAYHLAHASLPLCEEEQALRLLAADELIEAGVTPEALMKAQGFDPTPLALLRANFNQAQPRWAAGSGRDGDRWKGDVGAADAASCRRSRRLFASQVPPIG